MLAARVERGQAAPDRRGYPTLDVAAFAAGAGHPGAGHCRRSSRGTARFEIRCATAPPSWRAPHRRNQLSRLDPRAVTAILAKHLNSLKDSEFPTEPDWEQADIIGIEILCALEAGRVLTEEENDALFDRARQIFSLCSENPFQHMP